MREVYQSQLEYITRKVLKAIWIVFGAGGAFISLIAFCIMLAHPNDTCAIIIVSWLAFIIIFAPLSYFIVVVAMFLGVLYEKITGRY